MPDNRRPRGKRHFYRGGGKKAPNAAVSTPKDESFDDKTTEPGAKVATPPLTIPIPLDTPRFTDPAIQRIIHPTLLQTITDDLKFDHMTPVQAATFHDLLAERRDCLAQAKTGTGKTIAFLLPAIQNLINKGLSADSRISLLVISPTRELAIQIAKEAKRLLQRFPGYKVCFAIGGTNKDTEEKNILAGCDILIATPGRLYDHMSDAKILYCFRSLDTLVLDEADRLLDMGFINALKSIIGCLPKKDQAKWQGMLFSATIAPHVEKLAHLVLSKDYKFISTIPAGEMPTHERVPQQLITVPNFASVAPALVGSLRHELSNISAENFKAIVFAPTAAQADFYGTILESLPNLPPISVLHSRSSQSKRSKITNSFRDASSSILVATDLVARGMDFPAVTTVFQVGIPADKESYIHRLGRTARAGAEGKGIFIIASCESFFPTWTLKEIHFENQEPDLSSFEEVRSIAEKMEDHKKVYQAWLGYYKGHCKALKWDNTQLVEEANRYAREGLGAPETPALEKSTVSKMGLRGTKGLVVVPDAPRAHHRAGGGEGRSAGSGGKGKRDPK